MLFFTYFISSHAEKSPILALVPETIYDALHLTRDVVPDIA